MIPSRMYGMKNEYKKMYDIIKYWDGSNSSEHRDDYYIYHMGWTIGDAPYHGWVDKPLQNELYHFNEVEKTYTAFKYALQNALGVKAIQIPFNNIAISVVSSLKALNATIATVESCTGGLISSAITSVSGASDVFKCGICTYSNEAKMNMVGVSEETLNKYTAVSSETAIEMADGILKVSGADYAVSTTGYASTSPDPLKPPGTIYIGIAGKDIETYAIELNLNFLAETSKEATRQKVVDTALTRIDSILKNKLSNQKNNEG